MTNNNLGLDYNGLNRHIGERKVKQEEDMVNLELATSADDFYQRLTSQHNIRGLNHTQILGESIPVKHWREFRETIEGLVRESTETRWDIDRVNAFAGVLANHQRIFFGEDPQYQERRSAFAQAVTEMGDVPIMQGDARVVYESYATLVGVVDIKVIRFFVQTCKNAGSMNCNFTCSVAEGLIGLLINLPLPKAKQFVSEAFQLLKYEPQEDGRSGGTLGLQDAQAYITRATEQARGRFYELLGQ